MIKRYNILGIIGADTDNPLKPLPCNMVEDEDGKWVKYEDVKKYLPINWIKCLDCGKKLAKHGAIIPDAWSRYNVEEGYHEGSVCNECHFKRHPDMDERVKK